MDSDTEEAGLSQPDGGDTGRHGKDGEAMNALTTCLEQVQDHLVSILERGEADHVVILSRADLDAMEELMFDICKALSQETASTAS